MEYTPGPWAMNPAIARVDAFDKIVPTPVCALLWPTDLRTEAETEANARLIAAAPDMLAALQASEREYENLEDSAPVDSGCIECTVGTVPNHLNTGLCAHHLRRAAIAKATGR